MDRTPTLAERHPVRFGLSIAGGYVSGRGATDVMEPVMGYWPALLVGVLVAILVVMLIQELGRRSSVGG